MADQLNLGAPVQLPVAPCGEHHLGLHSCPLDTDHPGEHVFWSWTKTDAQVARPYHIYSHTMNADGALEQVLQAHWPTEPTDQAVHVFLSRTFALYAKILKGESLDQAG